MPQDADATSEERPSSSRPKSQTPETSPTWFTTPRPIRRLFDKFPLRIYPVNELPQRSPRIRERHSLWVFTTDEDAQLGAPSFNPGCLKWQVSWRKSLRLGDGVYTDGESPGLYDIPGHRFRHDIFEQSCFSNRCSSLRPARVKLQESGGSCFPDPFDPHRTLDTRQ